jgi:hypothetical protein
MKKAKKIKLTKQQKMMFLINLNQKLSELLASEKTKKLTK